jgi:hypothetical protein
MYRFGHRPGSDTRPKGRHLMCLQRRRATYDGARRISNGDKPTVPGVSHRDCARYRATPIERVSVTSSVVGQSAWLAVRDELIRQGVRKSAVRILISAATGTGIEARSVAVSVFRQQSTSPAV